MAGLRVGGEWRPRPDPGAVPLHDLGHRHGRHVAARQSRTRRWRSSMPCAVMASRSTSCRRRRHQLRARLVFEGDSISNIAHQLGYFETVASWRLVPALGRRIDAVTPHQVAEAAAQLPQDDQSHDWLVRSADLRRTRVSPPVGEGASSGPVSSARDDPIAHATSATTAQRGLAPVRSVLDNGTSVIAKHAGATPAVTLLASFEAGTIFDPPSELGVSHFVSRTIDRGTATHTADDIAERLENRGVSLAMTVNRHGAVAGLHVPGRGRRRHPRRRSPTS